MSELEDRLEANQIRRAAERMNGIFEVVARLEASPALAAEFNGLHKSASVPKEVRTWGSSRDELLAWMTQILRTLDFSKPLALSTSSGFFLIRCKQGVDSLIEFIRASPVFGITVMQDQRVLSWNPEHDALKFYDRIVPPTCVLQVRPW